MIVLRLLLPLLVLATVTFIAIYPWAIAPEWRQAMPLLPLAVIVALNARRHHAVPDWLAFAAGLVVDAMTLSPIGLWALVYVCATATGNLLQPLRASGRAFMWLVSAPALGLLVGVAWAAASLYALAPVDATTLAKAAGAIALVFPLVDIVLAPFAWAPADHDHAYTARGA